MAKCLVPGLFAVLLLVSAASAGITWHTTEIDLGFVYRDEPRKMSFGFVNTSEDTVFVFDIEPSCDCTSAQAIPSAVPPHNTSELVAFFDPMGYEGRGKLTEYIRLATSDPESPEAEVYFSVEVGIGPEPTPRALNFGSICKGESDTLDLVVNPGSDGVLEVLRVDSNTDCIKVHELGVRPDNAWEFKVIACNLDCRGAISGHISINTTDPIRGEIRIPVTANLMGTIVIEPEVMAFGPTLPGSEVAQGIKVYCTENLRFEIKKVTCSANSVECEISAAENNVYEIRLKIKEGAPAGRVAGQIIIETDCESQPLLTAKVTGYVRSREQ